MHREQNAALPSKDRSGAIEVRGGRAFPSPIFVSASCAFIVDRIAESQIPLDRITILLNQILHVAFCVLAVIVGISLVCISVFLTESEECAVEDLLAKWWIVIKDHEAKDLPSPVAFMQVVTQVASTTLDRLFGPKIMSLMVISGWMAVVLLIAIAFGTVEASFFIFNPYFILSQFFTILYFLIYGVLLTYVAFARIFGVSPDTRRSCHYILLLLFWSASVGGGITTLLQGTSQFRNFIIIFFGTLASFFIFSLSRLLLRLIRSLASWQQIFITMLGYYALAGFFCGLPFVLLHHRRFEHFFEKYGLSDAIAALLVANIPLAIPALAFTFLAIVMLGHRIFWPALHRPIYALHRFGLFRHRKIVGFVGSMIIIASLKSIGVSQTVIAFLTSVSGKVF
jgi:hypothetical protein